MIKLIESIKLIGLIPILPTLHVRDRKIENNSYSLGIIPNGVLNETKYVIV